MTDETEVIDSTHVYTDQDLTDSSQRSPAYRTTYVTPAIRTVKFKNSATFRDERQGKSMRIRFGIDVEGDVDWNDWIPYSSPEQLPPELIEKVITVPPSGPYSYEVKTRYELEEQEGVQWAPDRQGEVGPYTAEVEEQD
jgi:hypothetical protein